ncbi:hypothetical protein BUALT_Bualt02G0014600 [Buddleja alternifolia]|uniref:Uncharacterized protein n=1 Tax=Buddleja alternifolia TaxID=168488 RepID=A0AAV6XYN5_9LAMI|nr:hypothetical protein BUALT_Bualt02G0014600 [Buddleja alternifolia]
MGEEKPKSAGIWPTVKPFVNGGCSGMLATSVIQPIDMIKVRMQLGQGSAAEVTRNMLKNDGVGAFYKVFSALLSPFVILQSMIRLIGLSAGLLRQATYTTARLGSFKILTNKAIEANDGKPLPLYQKALCGLTAGAIGACFGNPADLALVRMQADATLPAHQRRNYTNAFQALYRIVADEGVLALWKGAGPTVVRAMALNMGMLASYDQSVEFFRDNLGLGEASTILGASSVSGFFAASCSLPFDYIKTQIQKMQPDAQGKYPYTGSLDCAMKTLKAGGPFKFYTGFPVYCVRIAPHVMMTWIFLNQIQKFEKSIGLILTKILKATNNDGMPLSLNQEACCGLISGATAASIYWPLRFASNSLIDPWNFSYRNLFINLNHKVKNEGALVLWKGSGLYIGTLMAANMGMLVSYNRSLTYLMENTTLSKLEAQLGASIVSRFFASACAHPCVYVKAMKGIVKKQYNDGKKNAYRNIPGYISHILTPHSGFKFYSGFLKCYRRNTRFYMVQWLMFENIRSNENKRLG